MMEVSVQNLYETIQKHINTLTDSLVHLLDMYEELGPIYGVLLPFIEAPLPFLPLIAFIFANVVAFGLIKGFVYSWIGASLGAIVVFFMTRKLQHTRFFSFVKRNKQFNKLMKWVEARGFSPLFILICLPFSPAFLINVVAALSKVRSTQFILAVLFGKSIMIFSIAYVGTTLFEFSERPLRTLVFL